ncbi:MAG: HNH endonuclease signature motif containing protein, partial [Paenisporosarcina sp.]|nr:HNH endonuclease signature motif containing protein [Paenisporosarcina sp.]
KSKEWLSLRQLALKRDKFECQMCKKKGKYHKAECVHHIKEVKMFPGLALTLSNLMCLCNACHNKVHDRMSIFQREQGKPKFTNKEQW